MEAGEVTMQMQEYIYLGTTPMYFLGASGRIVGSGRIESPHLHLPRRGPLSSFSRGISNPSSLSLSLSLSLFTLSSLSHFHRVYARECHTTPDRYSGDLRANQPRSPGLIDRQVMGQFNLISKINNRQRRRWSIYSEIPRYSDRDSDFARGKEEGKEGEKEGERRRVCRATDLLYIGGNEWQVF